MNHSKAKRQFKAGTPERLALEAVTPERYAKGSFRLYVDTQMLEGSEERTVDSIALKGETIPNCLLFLSGVEYEAVCGYHTLYEGARPAMTGGYGAKVDGGSANNDVYDEGLGAWSKIRSQVRGKGLRLIEKAFERDEIVLSVDQKEMIRRTAEGMALVMGLKN